MIIFMPQIRMLSESKNPIIPIDWSIKSDITLPGKPNKFLMSVFSGYKKLGSTGE